MTRYEDMPDIRCSHCGSDDTRRVPVETIDGYVCVPGGWECRDCGSMEMGENDDG